MSVWRLLQRITIYSGLMVLVEGLVISVWWGKYGFLVAVGAWCISILNMFLLARDGMRLLSMNAVQAKRYASRNAALRLLTVGGLLIAFAFLVEDGIAFSTVGLIFLGVYLSVLATFVVTVLKGIYMDNNRLT